MTTDERTLISGLFDRLAPLALQPRDAEAEALINSKVNEQPASPYLLVQTSLVIQQALTAAQTRIAELEKQLADARSHPQAPRSFLSDVTSFLGGGAPATPTRPVQTPSVQAPPPIPAPQVAAGGGFLQSALSTAAGVAGGALLFQGIEGLLGHNAGPFSGISGGGLGGGAVGGQPEVVNNYFEEGPSAGSGDSGNQDLADSSFNDPTDDFSDPGDDGSFDPGGDDSSFV